MPPGSSRLLLAIMMPPHPAHIASARTPIPGIHSNPTGLQQQLARCLRKARQDRTIRMPQPKRCVRACLSGDAAARRRGSSRACGHTSPVWLHVASVVARRQCGYAAVGDCRVGVSLHAVRMHLLSFLANVLSDCIHLSHLCPYLHTLGWYDHADLLGNPAACRPETKRRTGAGLTILEFRPDSLRIVPCEGATEECDSTHSSVMRHPVGFTVNTPPTHTQLINPHAGHGPIPTPEHQAKRPSMQPTLHQGDHRPLIACCKSKSGIACLQQADMQTDC